MKLTDIILIVIVGIFGIFMIFVNTKQLVVDGVHSYNVVVRVDSEVYGTYPLDDVHDIRIDTVHGFNEIHIENGEVSITDADCDDQICVNTKSIKAPGQSIICLPYRVSVEIIGDYEEESEIDDISQ